MNPSPRVRRLCILPLELAAFVSFPSEFASFVSFPSRRRMRSIHSAKNARVITVCAKKTGNFSSSSSVRRLTRPYLLAIALLAVQTISSTEVRHLHFAILSSPIKVPSRIDHEGLHFGIISSRTKTLRRVDHEGRHFTIIGSPTKLPCRVDHEGRHFAIISSQTKTPGRVDH